VECERNRRRRRARSTTVAVGLVAALAVTTLPTAAGAAGPSPLSGAPEWRRAAATRSRTPDLRVARGRRLALDPTALALRLGRAPGPHGPRSARPIVVGVPTPEGAVARFAVTEAPVVEPGLAVLHPETRTYAGTGIDDPAATVRLDLGPLGFHAQVRAPGGGWLIDPEIRGDNRSHVAYRRAALTDVHGPRRATAPRRPVRDRVARSGVAARTATGATAARTVGSQLRTYRLALATTGEYAQYFGGTVTLVNNALVAAVNRINGIFVPELGVRLVLVAGNSGLISLNPATDPYTNDDGGALLTQNQARIDAVIGSANYDIGHVFSTGGGGLAALGVVGLPGLKAQGETGSSAPNGDAFWVDYVAHELGHQFGGNHTFNGIRGNCSGNGETSASVEPGSGTTIMGYAGICDNDDLQVRSAPSGSSDAYFHAKSFDEIQAVVTSPGQGGTVSATGNLAPVVTTVAAPGVVPPRTPFALTASATDANSGDSLSLQWEQYDAGGLRALDNVAKPNGALFRSFPPTAGATLSRTFPRLSSILANTTNAATGGCPALPGGLACWSEFLPTSARTLKFRVTARDNRTTGGGVANADATVTVAGTTPFRITSQNSPTSVAGGAPLTVTWNVAGTTAPPFSFANVEIRLTTNGGASYTTLAASTPNDGSQSVTAPSVNTTAARIQVRPIGAIFFDLTDANLTISSLARLLGNPGFENGASPAPWTASAGVIGTGGSVPARTGSWRALLGGDGTATTETLTQTVALPTGVASASLAFWLRTSTSESAPTAADTLTVQLRNPTTDALIATLGQYSNLNAGASYSARLLGLTPYAGQTVRIAFVSQENAALATSFAVDDAVVSVQMLGNGGFESGSTNPAPWVASAGVITDSGAFPARTGAWKARFGGTGATSSWTLNRPLSVPASAAQALLACWLRITTDETGSTAFDTLSIQLRNASTNAVVSTIGQYSNVDAGTGYVQRTYDVSAYRGQSLRLALTGQEDSSFATSFLLDDCTLTRY